MTPILIQGQRNSSSPLVGAELFYSMLMLSNWRIKNRVCTVEGCGRKHAGRGFCQLHWKNWRASPEYERFKKEEKFCSIIGCGGKFYAKDLCCNHYQKSKQKSRLQYVQKRDIFRVSSGYYRTEHSKRVHREYMRKYMGTEKYKASSAAHSAVRRAIKVGLLKVEECEFCGRTAQAHHDSYLIEDHLKIRWLCSRHHADWHLNNEPIYPS